MLAALGLLFGCFANVIMSVKDEISNSPDVALVPGSEMALIGNILNTHQTPFQVLKWGMIVLWCYSVVDAFLVGSKKATASSAGDLLAGTDLPKTVTASEMRTLDERSETEFGVSALTLMENAGQAVAKEILKILSSLPTAAAKPQVVVLCGKGNNGGDGIATARALRKQSISASVFYIEPEGKSLKTSIQYQLGEALTEKVPLTPLREESYSPDQVEKSLRQADLVVDALLGTGSRGEPEGIIKTLIDQINQSLKPALSIDIPSGLGADTGKPSVSCVKACWTVTLGLVKTGLLKPEAKNYIGGLRVVDIGHPKEVLKSASL